jgi:hypothetical protein
LLCSICVEIVNRSVGDLKHLFKKEAETSQDVSEAEGSVIPDTPQEPSEPLAKFVIPGINVAVFPSR